MAKIQAPKILYFIDGPVPNSRNRQEAQAYIAKGAKVVFRNARFATKDDVSVEENTAAVLGDEKIIPEIYKKANLLSADAAVAKYTEAMENDAKAATTLNNDGEEDNMGSHSLPSAANIPVRARSRDDDGKTQQHVTQAPQQLSAGQVAPAPSPRPGAGPAEPVTQQSIPAFAPATGTMQPGQQPPAAGAPGTAGAASPQFAQQPPAFDPNNPPKA